MCTEAGERDALREVRSRTKRLIQREADDTVSPVEGDGLVVVARDVDRATGIAAELHALVLMVEQILAGIHRQAERSAFRQREARTELRVLEVVRKVVAAADPLDDLVRVCAARGEVPRGLF